MPQNVSSSSSKEEAEVQPEKSKENARTAARFQVPSDFVTFCHEPCSSTRTNNLKKNNRELWLIKAPTGFSPQSFSGLKVALSGLQTFRAPSAPGYEQTYNVLASTLSPSELRLLTADRRGSTPMVLGPAFSGLLNVCESYGAAADRTPHVIPAAPAPTIPAGLKLRLHLSHTPPRNADAHNEVDGYESRRSNKKKRRKEKRLRDGEECLEVKQEVEEEVMTEGEEKRKKKKKKREKEREERGEQSVRVKEEQIYVKPEPVDSYRVPTENNGKKKRKKKREEGGQLEEEGEQGVMVKEEVMVKCEPLDSSYGDLTESYAKKKKKKKKSQNEED